SEFLRYRLFILFINHMQGTGLMPRKFRRLQNLQPPPAALHREFELFSRRLPDRPDHAEVADRSAGGQRATLKHCDAQSPPRRGPSMGQPENSGSCNCYIDLQGDHQTILSNENYGTMIAPAILSAGPLER